MKLGRKQINIIGHPGTGKTTKLAEIVLDISEGDQDYVSRHMMGANFSRSAARAMIKKLGECGIDWDKLNFFKTIHSLASRVLELGKKNFAQSEDAIEFFYKGYNFPYYKQDRTIDDIELFGYVGSLSNASKAPLGNQLQAYFQYLKRVLIYDRKVRDAVRWHKYSEQWRVLGKLPGEFLLDIYDKWERFKRKRGKYEYDDMLQEICENKRGFMANIEYAVVDEAQDLSPLQVEVLRLWLKEAKEVYLAYDSMQTLYFFNGATPELIEKLERDKVQVLDRSYRLPRKIWEGAKQFAYDNLCRSVDYVKPRAERGDVVWINEERIGDLISKAKNNTFILFRDNHSLFSFLGDLYLKGIFVKGLGRVKTIFDHEIFALQYSLMRKLHREEELDYMEVRSFIVKTPAKYLRLRGIKTSFGRREEKYWNIRGLTERDTISTFFSLFKKVDDVKDIKNIIADPKFFLGYGKRGEAKRYLLRNITANALPIEKIKVYAGTMHSAKGLECNNCVIFDYIPPRGARRFDENCIAFTALTRARNTDYIVPTARGKRQGVIERCLMKL